ncbi:hypothetical protein [Methylobacterium sp. CM6246]
MPHLPKRHAYLVAVSQKREAVRVYAVLAETPDAALEAVALNAPAKSKLEIVGSLSRALVKRIGLKPGELRLV